jgi:hypothetical protein
MSHVLSCCSIELRNSRTERSAWRQAVVEKDNSKRLSVNTQEAQLLFKERRAKLMEEKKLRNIVSNNPALNI